MTKFRMGLSLGLATGYYLGARAGRERYHQINRAGRELRRRGPLIKARAMVELGRERVRTHDTATYVTERRDALANN